MAAENIQAARLAQAKTHWSLGTDAMSFSSIYNKDYDNVRVKKALLYKDVVRVPRPSYKTKSGSRKRREHVVFGSDSGDKFSIYQEFASQNWLEKIREPFKPQRAQENLLSTFSNSKSGTNLKLCYFGQNSTQDVYKGRVTDFNTVKGIHTFDAIRPPIDGRLMVTNSMAGYVDPCEKSGGDVRNFKVFQLPIVKRDSIWPNFFSTNDRESRSTESTTGYCTNLPFLLNTRNKRELIGLRPTSVK